ncbi:phosphopantetheine-binding protein [Niabella aurantiaca]|uniref:phosphopantetheine-binding protein n=1 Tax=Niabella aurantiaca TaxID=379900 RepID=UPI00038097CE|nr:phosphopantetheine-binding protein [Niabella aurantiaca]
MENKQELIHRLKEQIIKQLKLENKRPEDIGDHDPLFVDGLGLDSIDALELIVLLQQEYNIKLRSAEEGQDVFRSIDTMADYILEHSA